MLFRPAPRSHEKEHALAHTTAKACMRMMAYLIQELEDSSPMTAYFLSMAQLNLQTEFDFNSRSIPHRLI